MTENFNVPSAERTTDKAGGEGGDPKAAPSRRNPPKPAMHLRSGAAKLEAGARVAAEWARLCQNEPLMVELLLPEELRKALGELAREHAV